MSDSLDVRGYAKELFNQPLVMRPNDILVLGSVYLPRLRKRMGLMGADDEGGDVDLQAFKPVASGDGASVEVFAPRASRFIGSVPVDDSGRPLPYRMTPQGVAIITIVGELVNRGTWFGSSPSGGLVAYEAIKHQVATAAADKRVKSILIDMSSPGGMVTGCFDLAAAIRKAREIKPVIGFVNGVACSGGYALMSACTRIVAIQEASVGSIGVYWLHFDFSAALAMEGVKPTLIHDGDHKVDGNPYEPLSTTDVARFQADIAKAKAMFVECVVAGRPNLTAEAVIATQALVYNGPEALALGLIDSVGTFEDLLAELTLPDPNMLGSDDSSETQEKNKKQGASSPANTGALADAAATEEGMDAKTLKGKLAVALAAVGLDGVLGDTPPVASTDAGGSTSATGASGSSALIEGKKTIVAPSVHYAPAGAGSEGICKSIMEGDKGTTDLNMVTCGDCLRGEIVRSREAAEGSVVDPAATAKTIETAADTFIKEHCANIGADGTAAFKTRFIAAKTANDDAAIKDLETMAASYPAKTKARVDTSKGPKVADVANIPTSAMDINDAVLEKLAAEGVTQAHPEFATKYAAARATVLQGTEAA